MVVNALVLRTWEARFAVETMATERFAHLARRLRDSRAPQVTIELAAQASLDEQRHAVHCQTVVTRFGGPVLQPSKAQLEYAPRNLAAPDRLLYDVVAQSCIAETESTTTLVTLLNALEDPQLRAIVHELAKDEVNHGRLGWAYLAWCREQRDVSFLGPLLPKMIEGSAGPELFQPAPDGADDGALLQSGVVPHSLRRRLYVDTLESVIFAGFEQYGIDTGPARRWLASKQQPSAASPP